MRKVATFAVLLFFLLVCGAEAQLYKGTFNLTPLGGIGIPLGGMADDDIESESALARKLGFKFGAMLEYWLTYHVSAGVNIRYATFGAKEIDGMDVDSRLNLIMGGPLLKYHFTGNEKVVPFVMISGGIIKVEITDVNVYDPELDEMVMDNLEETRTFISGGGGVNYFVTPSVSIYGEATFDYLLTDGAGESEESSPEGEPSFVVEANYFFVDIAAGVTFWFGGEREY